MRTLLSALLFATVAAAQAFDELLPDSTVIYVSIENVARTQERWGQSPLAALWKDEAMQGFLEKPRTAWDEWMEEIRREGDFTPEDVLDLLSGQAILAAVWPQGADTPKLLALADIGENGEKLRELVAKIEKHVVEEKGNRRDEEEFHGVKIVRYTKPDEDAEEAGGWFLDGSTFAMAENTDALKDVLARKEPKEEGTLATRELYRRTRGRIGARAADFFAYVDAPNILKGLQDSGEIDADVMRILDALGVSAVEAAALEVAIEPGGLMMRMFLGVKGPKAGILKLLDGKNSELTPPRYAPADALTAGAYTLDLPALYEEARKVADRIQEGSSAQIDAVLGMIKAQTGVDVAADLIAPLGSEIAYHTSAPTGGAGDDATALGMARVAFSIQLKDRERFEAALDKLFTAAMPGMATQDYLGVKLRLIPTRMGVQPALAVLPDRFLFGLAADDVKDVIARFGKETKGFLDREDIAKALASLPAQRFAVSVEDLPKSLSAASSSLAGAMGLLARSRETRRFAQVMDFSRFPSAEVLAKYLGMNVACLVNEEDGVSYLGVLHLVEGASAPEGGEK